MPICDLSALCKLCIVGFLSHYAFIQETFKTLNTETRKDIE